LRIYPVTICRSRLQEPLRKIQTFGGLLLKRENDALSDNGKSYIRFMQEAAQRMQILIEDLLAFSQSTTSERKFEVVDLKVIVDKVKFDLSEIIEEKQAIIEISESCQAPVIVFQFNQLMNNLIGNALKFSSPLRPPHIQIKFEMVEDKDVDTVRLLPDNTYCHISVSDNGIGFEAKFSEKIFELFQKLHGRGEYPGTGIGLAIVKKIANNHHGYITATGELNKGATFDIYIPAN
jgi:two-component system CheB/CheR fusion protein